MTPWYNAEINLGDTTPIHREAALKNKTYFMIACIMLQVQLTLAEDRGPNGALIKAKFKPPFSVGLVVTLYKVCIMICYKVKCITLFRQTSHMVNDPTQKGLIFALNH